MNPLLQNTINVLPDILAQNAPSMMRRMLAAMQHGMAQDNQLPNAAYSTLLLKVSEPDLVREFAVAIKHAVEASKLEASNRGQFASSLSMSLEPLEDTAGNASTDFLPATASFNALTAHAKKLGVTGLSLYKKELFLAALKDTFVRARIDGQEVNKIMPYANRALCAELVNVYGKLNAVQRDAAVVTREASSC